MFENCLPENCLPENCLWTAPVQEADRLADGIVVIDHGKVIARGTADQLKSQVGGHRLEFTVSEAAELPILRERVAPLGSTNRRSTSSLARCPCRSAAEPRCCATRCGCWTIPV